jgi:hypothetical protein
VLVIQLLGLLVLLVHHDHLPEVPFQELLSQEVQPLL